MKHPPFICHRPFALTLLLLCCALVTTVCGQARPERNLSDERRNRTSDQAPSSILVYNLYTSDAANRDEHNTRLTLTNTDPTVSVKVHLFFIDANGSVADAYLALTGNQTVQMFASAFDPGVSGYAVVVAVNDDGCPISFNRLVGSEAFKLPSGVNGGFSAEGFSALYAGALPGCAKTATDAILPLDGKTYTAPASRLALDSIPSLADGNTTTLIINSLQANYMTGVSALGELAGVVYNDVEDAFSFSAPANTCQLNLPLSATFPRLAPRLPQVIPTERSGWMQVFAKTGKAISGAVINTNANVQINRVAYNTGHNLHHLSSTTGSITVPVFPPNV